MKQVMLIITFLIMTISYCHAQPGGQIDPGKHTDPNIFRVIDMKINSSNYLIVTSRDDLGRTFQFYTGKSDPISLGLPTLPDFARGTVSPGNIKKSNYVILKPFFINQCCSISKIEYGFNNQTVDLVIAKGDTANGLTYFNMNSSPGVTVKIEQPIYQKIFNNKRYAILKPLDEKELNRNIFYSYEFKFMSREQYNSIRNNVKGNSTVISTKDSAFTPLIITDTSNVTNDQPLPDSTIPIRKTDTSIVATNQEAGVNLTSTDPGNTEVSEIMFGKNMATGILHIDLPDDVEGAVNIYSIPDHTLLFNSIQQRSFSLLPGMYDIEISGMSVKNIPVNKGMDTRIKTGVLSIPLHGPWTLYDKDKTKVIHSSSQSKKLGLPTGIYQLEINGAWNQVEIRDHEILDYDTSRKTVVEVQQPTIADSAKNTIVNTIETTVPGKKWELKKNPSLKGTNGRIFLTIPKQIETVITITQPVTEKEVHYSGILTKERSFSLSPGNYNVKVSGYTVANVPVQKGMDTKIKAGVLDVTVPGIWTLYDEKKDKQVYFSTAEKKIGLPAGVYQLEINGTVNQVTIKDGETVKF